jgi:DNA processing protein
VHLLGAPVPACGRCAAIVGARAASPYGLAQAERLARDLAALGWTIVSGLARGIDAAAHRGALAAGGRTVAVLPGGLDTVTPPAHDPLAAEVAGAGTLLSEFASGPPFGRGAFPRRNRLIAALAAVTVVVEAAERSGSLSTAAAARRLGRGLCAVPGDLDRPTALGTLALLRDGARPCGSAADVIAAVPGRLRTPDLHGGAPMQRLAAALEDAPRAAEDLAAAAGLPLPEALAALLRLRWSGIAAESPGGRWRRA